MMRSATRLAPIVVLALFSACTRPLSSSETEVAQALFGDTLDTEAVTVTAGLGLLPLPGEPAPKPGAQTPQEPPPDLCERKRATKRVWRSPAAFVLWNAVFFDPKYYVTDAFRGFPASVPFPSSVIMAHELVHVWQWQNRARTGYTPTGAAGETVDNVDPYWFQAAGRAEFLTYSYEQQGAIVQDFVCYALFDHDDPKLAELTAILRPVLPVDGFLTKLRTVR